MKYKKRIVDLDYLELENICSKHPLNESCKTCPLNVPGFEHGCIKSVQPLSSFHNFVDYVRSKLQTEIECETEDAEIEYETNDTEQDK